MSCKVILKRVLLIYQVLTRHKHFGHACTVVLYGLAAVKEENSFAEGFAEQN
jgi:hypothetical protein